VFALGFGPSNLITNDYRLSYVLDALQNPDGAVPTPQPGLPLAAAPANTLRQDLKTNDLRNWSPVAPVFLCGGDNDPTVYFSNTELMKSYWTAHAPAASVEVLNVDAGISIGGSNSDLKSAFATVKALVQANAVAGGATAILDRDSLTGARDPASVRSIRRTRTSSSRPIWSSPRWPTLDRNKFVTCLRMRSPRSGSRPARRPTA